MKKKLLYLLFLATILFFGSCAKDYLGENPLPQDSKIEGANSSTKSSYPSNTHEECGNCGACLNYDCTSCTVKCVCYCDNAKCPLCGLCIVAGIGTPRNVMDYCLPCNCEFYSQSGNLDCFMTAVYSVTTLMGMDVTMSYINNAPLVGNISGGVTTSQAHKVMDWVFGNKYHHSSDNSEYGMRDLLDRCGILITNYPVGLYYAHAVVIVGYVRAGDNIVFVCLDPAWGQYTYKYFEELDWENNPNKFLFVVDNYN